MVSVFKHDELTNSKENNCIWEKIIIDLRFEFLLLCFLNEIYLVFHFGSVVQSQAELSDRLQTFRRLELKFRVKSTVVLKSKNMPKGNIAFSKNLCKNFLAIFELVIDREKVLRRLFLASIFQIIVRAEQPCVTWTLE